MKHYAAIFLVTILSLTAFAEMQKAQETLDSYFAEQVRLSKPETNPAEVPAGENATAPANDNFADAEALTLGVNGTLILTRNTISASKEANEPNHAENAGGNSVWFNFTPTSTKAVEIRTISGETDFDTLLAVYTGNQVQYLTRLGANDDCFRQECGTRSRVRLLLQAGVTYRIAVDGYYNGVSSSSGTFKLIMESVSAAFEFDNINAAYDLGFANAGMIGMTNYLATAQSGEPTHYTTTPASRSVWFRFQTLSTRAMTFQVSDDFAGELAVYSSPAEFPTFAQLTKLDTNADNVGVNGGKYAVNFLAETNKYYFVVVDHNPDNAGQNETGNFLLKFFQTKLRYSMRLDSFTGHASMSLYRPSNATWYSHKEVNNFPIVRYMKFGLVGDTPVSADYDGDALTDYAVTRNQNGLKYWYIAKNDFNSDFYGFQWGLATDKAVVGDFDRDGRADAAVIRSVNGYLVWYIQKSSDGQMRSFVFGLTGDRPVLGDFDGDGATEITVARPTPEGLVWYILRSNGNQSYQQWSVLPFGLNDDKIAVEDYDGDGKSDVAVWRPSNGIWYILRSSTGQLQDTPFGSAGDRPQPADYDNDGKSELAVYRPSEGKWYFWFSATDTQTVKQWGVATDIPVSSLNTLVQ